MAEKYIRNRPEAGGGLKQDLGEKDVQNGVAAIIRLLHEVRDFMGTAAMQQATAYEHEREAALLILKDSIFEPVFKEKPGNKIAFAAQAAFDQLFRNKVYDKIEQILEYVYRLDLYLSVAGLASKRGFVFPEVFEKGSKLLQVQGLYHPELKHPVANDVAMENNNSLIFLTGANMAGKSTFLRSVSTAVYIAHMGFPVAATQMRFSVMDGIYTTINLPDNLGIGASHFYAEVLRVKKIATELNRGKHLFVIFDELFRGTNVKDAYEATVAVSRSFARKTTCRFIISSHIVEAAEELQQQPEIDFFFLPTRMNGITPEYTYTLERGVTADRHGMIIIKNEGILEILHNGRKRAVS
jgi:DNA mismatch repair ATPase MutS